MMFVPEESVLLPLLTVSIEVPTAPEPAVMLPPIDTRELGVATPIASGPPNVDVAVDVETTDPAMNRPCAVVEARFALVVAVRFPKMPSSAENAAAKRFVDVAFASVVFPVKEFAPLNWLSA
jgi:hypothetical protein